MQTTVRGMMIAIPAEHWAVFGQMSPAEFVAVLLMLASHVNLRHFKKHARRPKRALPKPTYDPAHPHVSAASLLAQDQTRKRGNT